MNLCVRALVASLVEPASSWGITPSVLPTELCAHKVLLIAFL